MIGAGATRRQQSVGGFPGRPQRDSSIYRLPGSTVLITSLVDAANFTRVRHLAARGPRLLRNSPVAVKVAY